MPSLRVADPSRRGARLRTLVSRRGGAAPRRPAPSPCSSRTARRSPCGRTATSTGSPSRRSTGTPWRRPRRESGASRGSRPTDGSWPPTGRRTRRARGSPGTCAPRPACCGRWTSGGATRTPPGRRSPRCGTGRARWTSSPPRARAEAPWPGERCSPLSPLRSSASPCSSWSSRTCPTRTAQRPSASCSSPTGRTAGPRSATRCPAACVSTGRRCRTGSSPSPARCSSGCSRTVRRDRTWRTRAR